MNNNTPNDNFIDGRPDGLPSDEPTPQPTDETTTPVTQNVTTDDVATDDSAADDSAADVPVTDDVTADAAVMEAFRAEINRKKRPPLVLSENDVSRSRPAVTEEDLAKHNDARPGRPALNPEEIHGPAEREVHDGRITGEKHSHASTAAPVRTRTPEANRGVTNGIPVRTVNRPAVTVEEEPKPKKGFGLIAAVIAALCVVVMLTVVVLVVNGSYRVDNSGEPDYSMNEVPDGKVIHLEDGGEELFEDEETEPAETAGEDPAPETEGDVETSDGETEAPPETMPPETAAPETEARFTVTIDAYNRTPITVTTSPMTVGELFSIVGFSLGENDRMNLTLDTRIDSAAVIKVDTVEYRSIQKTSIIPFASVTNEVQTIPRGERVITQQGEEGYRTLTYDVEYVNGQEVNRTLVSEVVTKEPVTQISDLGVGGELVGSDGVTYTYSYYRVVPATYYNIEGLTWVGTPADEGTIATNFDYIPLHTRVYVKNDKFDFGVRTVEDTGTMKGYEVDIWIGPDNPQLEAFAYIGYHHDMVIYYLD